MNNMYKILNKVTGLLIVILVLGISADVLADVQITDLQDVSFGTVYPPYASNLTDTDNVCVYNSAATTYTITATGLNSVGTVFYLSSVSGTIEYSAEWNDTSGWTTLDSGVSGNFDGATTSTCTGAEASLRITIYSSSLSPVPQADTYTDTLTLLLGPI